MKPRRYVSSFEEFEVKTGSADLSPIDSLDEVATRFGDAGLMDCLDEVATRFGDEELDKGATGGVSTMSGGLLSSSFSEGIKTSAVAL